MKKFLDRMDKALLGSVTFLTTFILGFLWWIYQPSDTVPMWLFSVCFIAYYMICLIIYAISSREEEIVYRLPLVRAIYRDPDRFIIILEKSDLFSYNSLATISYQREDVEIILGLGCVETINSEGNAQVVFIRPVESDQVREIIDNLSNTSQSVRALRIKPSVTMELLGGMRE